MRIDIRRAETSDLEAMREAKDLAGRAAWGHILPEAVIAQLPFPQRWTTSVREPPARTAALVVELDATVVGFAITRPSEDADATDATGELDSFYTLPSAWGLGAGRVLLDAATEQLASSGFDVATLWTAQQNHRPRRIYEAAGWSLDGAERPREFGGTRFVELRHRRPLGGAGS